MSTASGLLFKGHGWRLKIRKSAEHLPGLDDESSSSDSDLGASPRDRGETTAEREAASSSSGGRRPREAWGSLTAWVPSDTGAGLTTPRTTAAMRLLVVATVVSGVVWGRHLVAGSTAGAGVSQAPGLSSAAIPQNVLQAENFNRKKALARWVRTLEWRREQEVDLILEQPHRYFHAIKKHYPHSIHLKDKDGCYTYWERPGDVDVKGLKRDGVNSDRLFWHYLWHTEYTWRIVAPKDGAKVTVVQDYGGFTPERVSFEVLNFIKRAVHMTSEYYPERAHRILLVNLPEWYTRFYGVLKNFMSKKMQKRIHIFTAKDVQAGKLLKYISAANLPEAYGGKSKLALGESKEEKRMRSFVDKQMKKRGGGGGGRKFFGKRN